MVDSLSALIYFIPAYKKCKWQHQSCVLQLVRCDGKHILTYKDDLMPVLRATLHLRCKEASEIAGNVLRHLLRALTLIYTLDYRSTPVDWDAPLSEELPIRVSKLGLVHRLTALVVCV